MPALVPVPRRGALGALPAAAPPLLGGRVVLRGPPRFALRGAGPPRASPAGVAALGLAAAAPAAPALAARRLVGAVLRRDGIQLAERLVHRPVVVAGPRAARAVVRAAAPLVPAAGAAGLAAGAPPVVAAAAPGRPVASRAEAAGGLHGLDLPVHLPMERAPAAAVAGLHQGDRAALAAGAARAADAVGVVGDLARHAVVDHDGHVQHVEAAGGHVGGHQGLDLAGAEGGHDAEAGRLVVAAVERLDAEGQPFEPPHQPVDVRAPVAEDQQDVLGVRLLDQPDQDQRAVVVVHLDVALLDLLDGGDAARGGDLDRIAGLLAGQPQELAREGRREQEGLPLVGRVAQDLAHVVEEADLEHLVGLVQDDELGPGEGQELLADEVEHPPGRADHELGAGLEGLDLRVQRVAADHQGHLDVARAAELLEHPGDLLGQLAGGAQHEPQHGGPRRVDAGHHGRPEGQGLAGPGLGLGDHVPAVEHGSDREGLDGGRHLDAHGVDGPLELVPEIPFVERADVGGLGGGVQLLDRLARIPAGLGAGVAARTAPAWTASGGAGSAASVASAGDGGSSGFPA